MSRHRQQPKPTSALVERALTVLDDGAEHFTRELERRVGPGFGWALFELRRRGYCISTRPHPRKRHQFVYQLLARP